MSPYELPFLPVGEKPPSSVHFFGHAVSSLHLAQRAGHESELLRGGQPLCRIALDAGSGFWVISSLAGSGATAH